MDVKHHVESYRFWDVVNQWGRETLQHELLVARALAKAVLRDGLRLQSVDPKWTRQGAFELRGAPFVGYVAKPGGLPVFLRAGALKHLSDVVERAATPDPAHLHEEFLTRQDFAAWLDQQGLQRPAFWYPSSEFVHLG